ncbi:MAG: hypothetical protein ACPGVH_08805 [Chitinophagales bacterium]
MKLIADSGSTKTSWLLLAGENTLQEFETKGMNPFFISEDEIIDALEDNLRPDVIPNIKEVHFFGAGCSNQEKAEWLQEVIEGILPNASVFIKTDIEGAVLACSNFGEKSVVSILGTGTSFRIFDGEKMIKLYSSLGYIIGDEGSGTHISKALLRKLYYNQLSVFFLTDFNQYFETTREKIIGNVYSKAFPNRYLAQFTKFCSRHIASPEIEKIVLDSFDAYFKNHLTNIPEIKEHKLHFVGSVAFHFKPQLEKVITKHGLKLGTIIQKPIHALARKI